MKTGIKILVIFVITLCLGGIYVYRVHQINQEELQKQELKRLDKLKWKLVKKNPHIEYIFLFTSAEKRSDPTALRPYAAAYVYPLNKNVTTVLSIDESISFGNLNTIGCYPQEEISVLQDNGFYGSVSQCDFYVMINDNLGTLRQIEGTRMDNTLLLGSFHRSESYIFMEQALIDSNKITFFIRRNDLKSKPMFFVEYQTTGFMDLDSYINHELEFMEENNFTPDDMNCSYGPGKCR